MAAVSGQVVEFLNDDTEVTAGWAKPALAAFADPSVAAVAPLVLFKNRTRINPDSTDLRGSAARNPNESVEAKFARVSFDMPLVDSAGDRYYLGGVAGKRGHRQPLNEAYQYPCRVFAASGSSGFFRREAVLRVGGFPDSFGAYFEDIDLAFRLNRAGYHIQFEPASRIFHHVSASYGLYRRQVLQQQSLNEERVFWRNLDDAVLARALPCHLVVLAGKALRRLEGGGLAPFLFGRLRVLAEILTIIRHRRALQRIGAGPYPESWGVEPRLWAT
jgi:GT2 family glycosyltransferase